MPRARRRTPRLPLPTARPPFGVGGFPARHALRRGRSHGLNAPIWRFCAPFAPFRRWGGVALHAGRETSLFLILGAFLRKARGFGRPTVHAKGRRLESPAFGGKSRHLRTPPPHGVSRGAYAPQRKRNAPSRPVRTPFAPPLHPLRLLGRTTPLHAAPQPPSCPAEGKPRRRPDGIRLAVFLL